jgi:hypothetical protein
MTFVLLERRCRLFFRALTFARFLARLFVGLLSHTSESLQKASAMASTVPVAAASVVADDLFVAVAPTITLVGNSKR